MTNESSQLLVPSDLKSLSDIRSFVVEAADRIGLSAKRVCEMRLAVDEACANIILHGYKNSDGDITICIDQTDNKMVVTLRDNAPLYNPLEASSGLNLNQPLEERALGGMGVVWIKQNTDSAEHQRSSSGGNLLILSKMINETTTRSK